jgi:tetratricopeptide (TPR) repeat protein
VRELEQEGATTATIDEEQAFDAEREKLSGNQAFSKREYGQAAVHYTVALDRPAFSSGHGRAVVLANRSACFLKLGDHQRALADAVASVGEDASYAKAHFRRGLALHALNRFREALPELGKARDLEPKNKEIKDAIRFAEMRLSRGK